MEYYLIIGLVIIIILLSIRKFSNFTWAETNSAVRYPTFVNPGYDVTGTTTMVQAAASYSLLSRVNINYNIYRNATVPKLDGGTINTNTVWGFRKQLQRGGGGPVWYITSVAAGVTSANPATSSDLVAQISIETYNYLGTNYAIPPYVILQKSSANGVFDGTCTNASVIAQAADGTGGACTCNAGYYGTTNCQPCGAGTYSAAGASSCSACPTGSTSPAGSVALSACTFQSFTINGTVGSQVPITSFTSSGCSLAASGIYTWTVPVAKAYTITLTGGGGGGGGTSITGGKGGIMRATITLSANQTVYLIVGGGGNSGSGGGLSAVFITSITTLSGTWMISGGGGGGLVGNGGDASATPGGGTGGAGTNGGGAGSNTGTGGNKGAAAGLVGSGGGGGGGCGSVSSSSTFSGGRGESSNGGFGGGGGLGVGGGGGGGGYTGGAASSSGASGGTCHISSGWTNQQTFTTASNGGAAGASGGAGSITIS